MYFQGKKGQYIWTEGRDEEALARGIYNTYTTKNLRYSQVNEPHHEKNVFAKTKREISCAVTAQLIRAFVLATWIVQFLFILNPELQTSNLHL